MPAANKRLTDSRVRALPLPDSSEVIWWCPETPGFGVRVSATGVKAYVLQRRVEGKDTRRTLAKATGTGAVSCEAARQLMTTISSELALGKDRMADRKAEKIAAVQDGTTLANALKAYVHGKRRGKDGLALKERTKADYVSMIATGGTAKDGKPFADGALASLAGKSIHRITAGDIREVYSAMLKRSQRQATYSMQVLRAVLNWHGVAVADSPLAKATAGKNRIILAPTAGKPRPIPAEKLAAWWAAASAKGGNVAADGCRFILLTGCRPGEVFGSEHVLGLLVKDVDLIGGRIILQDTKNRKEHTIMLSTQALALLAPHIKGKKPNAKVFDILYPGKTLDAINAEAEVTGITPHKLRHTFASVAEELVSGYALKRMLNHSNGDDVTGGHYVGKSENQLKTAWQAVADFITGTIPLDTDSDIGR